MPRPKNILTQCSSTDNWKPYVLAFDIGNPMGVAEMGGVLQFRTSEVAKTKKTSRLDFVLKVDEIIGNFHRRGGRIILVESPFCRNPNAYFSLVRDLATIEVIALTHGITIYLITPAMWRKDVLDVPANCEREVAKAEAIRVAKLLFRTTFREDQAEALLLALWGYLLPGTRAIEQRLQDRKDQKAEVRARKSERRRKRLEKEQSRLKLKG